MVTILMISVKMATVGFLKSSYFEIKVMTSYILSMTSPTKFLHVTQIILYMWLCDQNLLTQNLLKFVQVQ